MLDLKQTATELSSPDCRYSYEDLQNVCIYLAGKALSLERGNASLRAEIKNKKKVIEKLKTK